MRLSVLALALCIALVAPAHATCSVANQYRFEFGTAAATGLSYASSYSYAATSTALGSQNFTVSWPIVNGASSTVVATLQMPRIDPIINDGNPTTANNLIVGMILAGRTADITSGTNVVVTRFTFPTAIRTFSVQLNDIDFATNQFRDWIHISGSNGATVYSPSISTPAGNNNTSGPRTAPGSTINLGAAATPFIMTDREAIGNGTAPNTDDTGTLTAVFAQPITQVEIRYGNNGVSPGGGTTGQQAYGIQRVSWCPMPVLSVIKTSAPFSDPANGTTDPKLIPGGDLLYTITVNNADSSPVDLNGTVITDPLPGTVTFYNADIDDAGPLTTNFAFNAGTSGLSFGAANFTYSNNGGATYAYAPAPGYDPAVNALRFAPTGSMAANSSFSVQFRVRIR